MEVTNKVNINRNKEVNKGMNVDTLPKFPQDENYVTYKTTCFQEHNDKRMMMFLGLTPYIPCSCNYPISIHAIKRVEYSQFRAMGLSTHSSEQEN